MRCKICTKSVKATKTKGRHSWQSNQQCAKCHYFNVPVSGRKLKKESA
uniref:ORF11 n=1 Tax=Nitrosopumilaceae spindle-shaped virus TaxID=3065433 RepID=A0AAT9JHA1_9VIRU